MRTQPRTSVAPLLLTLLVLSSGTCLACRSLDELQASAPYKTAAKFSLSQASNGVDGYLELRQDARLTPNLIDLMWGIGDANVDNDPELAAFTISPPRNAEIEVVDRAGRILDVKKLERPLARFRTEPLYGDTRLTYLLTVDYSAGFGSYNGPTTSLIEVNSGHLRWIEATELRTGKTGQISLMDSLKTTWKLVDAQHGQGKQILLAQCRPDWSLVKGDPDFTTQYARFYFDGTRWLVKVRTVNGLSEFDQGFPSRRNFP